MPWRLALAALLLLGCAPKEPLRVAYVGDAAGAKAVQQAAEDWNFSCQETLVVLDDGGMPVVQHAFTLQSAAGPAYGLTTTDHGAAERIDFVETPFSEATIAHEMGHALGIHHENDDIENDVMNEDVRMPVLGKITPADCAEVRR